MIKIHVYQFYENHGALFNRRFDTMQKMAYFTNLYRLIIVKRI